MSFIGRVISFSLLAVAMALEQGQLGYEQGVL